MSHSSDSEEFFDAEDTLNRSGVKKTETENEAELSAELERQKEQLRQEQLRILERRRNEDEELQRKRLELMRIEEEQRKLQEEQELAYQALENENRRHKLEHMRQILCEESSPNRSDQPSPPSELTPGADATRRLHAELSAGASTRKVSGNLERYSKHVDTTSPVALDKAIDGDGAWGTNLILERYINDVQQTYKDEKGALSLKLIHDSGASRGSDFSTPTKPHSPTSLHEVPDMKIQLGESDLLRSIKRTSSFDRNGDKQLLSLSRSSHSAKTDTGFNLGANLESVSKRTHEMSSKKDDTDILQRHSSSSKASSSSGRLSRPTSQPPPPPTQSQSAIEAVDEVIGSTYHDDSSQITSTLSQTKNTSKHAQNLATSNASSSPKGETSQQSIPSSYSNLLPVGSGRVKSSSSQEKVDSSSAETTPRNEDVTPTDMKLAQELTVMANNEQTLNVPNETAFGWDHTVMPPPPVAPPRKRTSAVESSPQDKELTPGTTTVRPHSLAVPNSIGSGGKCLLTAPSPLVGRKPLDMKCALAGSRVVTASEEECTRAINDLGLDDNGSNSSGRSEESSTVDCLASQSSAVDSSEGYHADALEFEDDSSLDNKDTTLTRDTVAVERRASREKRPEVKSNRESRYTHKSHSFPRSVILTQPPSAGSDVDDMRSVLNLDTGLRVSQTEAEQRLPTGMNPLSLHIMRRTHEYHTQIDGGPANKGEEKPVAEKGEDTQTTATIKPVGKRRKRLRKFFGKAKQKLKNVKDEVLHANESSPEEESDEEIDESRRLIKIKASSSHKGPYDFDLLVPVQDMPHAHNGAVWTMKWAHCGRLLASGGQDGLLRLWALKDAFSYFDDMRQKYNEERRRRMSPSQLEQSLDSDSMSEAASEVSAGSQVSGDNVYEPLMRKPFCTYKGHSADILDISWSKNYFLLTSSMDKTVRLWHVSRKECLCCFQHIDFVTAIAFHPKDDRYFLSGSLDGKLRLWNIPEKKVALWNEVGGASRLITAANFCMNGKFAVVGTYDGRCVFYSTDQLKYYTQIHVRSTRGKNSKGRKITGVEPYPGDDKLLVTSNDSRIRLYDLRDLSLTCKYRGCVNNSSQIKASFSHTGRFLVCGSEDHFVYIWRTQHEFTAFSSARRDRSDYWESIKAHNAIVTVGLFSPKPQLVIRPQFEYEDSEDQQATPEVRGEVLISADYNGSIRVFINKFKPGSG